ncbi:MAG: HAD family phosphatase [Terrimicrobiaceae bacterium]
MKITAAIFDIGNVLLPFDYMKAANRLIEENQPVTPPDRAVVVAAKEQLELGRIDRGEFLRRVRPLFNHTGHEGDFLAIWEDIFVPNTPMHKLVEELSEHMPLYLLSNISDIHRESIHRDYPVFRYFQSGIYSYEVGLLKPDPAIFELTAQRLNVTPQATLFIDDMAENIASAEAAGFCCVHYSHTDHEKALEKIRWYLAR